ncbi:hypothetical protein Scep_029489 [Stephania cephalantha]|uniref:Uncharacterized protein n=1 Tax=Stephania cephalantha TaxID=152367 RepID=A0AAP0E5H0_9MAGN
MGFEEDLHRSSFKSWCESGRSFREKEMKNSINEKWVTERILHLRCEDGGGGAVAWVVADTEVRGRRAVNPVIRV